MGEVLCCLKNKILEYHFEDINLPIWLKCIWCLASIAPLYSFADCSVQLSFLDFYIQPHAAHFHSPTCTLLSFTLPCVLMVAQFSVSPDSVVVLIGVRENPFYFAQSNKLEASVCTCLLREKTCLFIVCRSSLFSLSALSQSEIAQSELPLLQLITSPGWLFQLLSSSRSCVHSLI